MGQSCTVGISSQVEMSEGTLRNCRGPKDARLELASGASRAYIYILLEEKRI